MNVTVTRTLHCFKDIMPAKRRRGRRTVRRGKRPQRGQRGGFFPLLALIPAAIAAGKAAALGAVSGAAGYGIKKALAGKKKVPKGKAEGLSNIIRRKFREASATNRRRRKVIDFARAEQRRLRA